MQRSTEGVESSLTLRGCDLTELHSCSSVWMTECRERGRNASPMGVAFLPLLGYPPVIQHQLTLILYEISERKVASDDHKTRQFLIKLPVSSGLAPPISFFSSACATSEGLMVSALLLEAEEDEATAVERLRDDNMACCGVTMGT